MISQPSRSNSLPLFSTTPPSSSRPLTPPSFSSKRPAERGVSPASSAGSHGSGVSHPPGSRKRRRTTIITDVSSDKLLSSIDKWDDGHGRSKYSADGRPSSLFSLFPTRRTRRHTRDHSPGNVPRKISTSSIWNPESPSDGTGKMSMLTMPSVPSAPPASKMGELYICDCCPRKPKKFDNPHDLCSHQMEKRYICQYCNNLFKNKKEAERHQNSLHLRRHSWSCAALSSFQAAFQGSVSISCQTNTGPSHDSCGYCGEEFPNFPRPDWDHRFEHLTTVHRFGECNSTKKYFRADFFGQHLKHSHAGSSGKWTDILENACMKEEQLSEPRNTSRSVLELQWPGIAFDPNQVGIV